MLFTIGLLNCEKTLGEQHRFMSQRIIAHLHVPMGDVNAHTYVCLRRTRFCDRFVALQIAIRLIRYSTRWKTTTH